MAVPQGQHRAWGAEPLWWQRGAVAVLLLQEFGSAEHETQLPVPPRGLLTAGICVRSPPFQPPEQIRLNPQIARTGPVTAH